MTAKNNMSTPMNFKEGLEDLISTAGAGAEGGGVGVRVQPTERRPC